LGWPAAAASPTQASQIKPLTCVPSSISTVPMPSGAGICEEREIKRLINELTAAGGGVKI
jgi:hypothetical protein